MASQVTASCGKKIGDGFISWRAVPGELYIDHFKLRFQQAWQINRRTLWIGYQDNRGWRETERRRIRVP
jgi:hypothetical protein